MASPDLRSAQTPLKQKGRHETARPGASSDTSGQLRPADVTSGAEEVEGQAHVGRGKNGRYGGAKDKTAGGRRNPLQGIEP